ncbi:MAG: PEGA domain-containing protein [Myxococcaceae bacterium]
MRRHAVTALLLILALWALPSAAAKPDAAARDEAAGHFGKGISFFKSGDYQAALAEFKAAHRALPGFEVLYNIGISERRLYRYGDAVRSLNQYLEEGGKAVSRGRREDVRRELTEIRALVAEATVRVEGAPAEVKVDGEVVGTSPLPGPLLLGPGKHVVRAQREGEEPDEKAVEVVSGTNVEVVLAPRPKAQPQASLAIDSLPPEALVTVDGKFLGAAPVKAKLAAGGHTVVAELTGYLVAKSEVVLVPGQERTMRIDLEPEQRKQGRKLFVPGLALAGGGAALLGGGMLFGLQAQGASKKVSELFATGGAWDENYQRLEGAGQAGATWSAVLTTVGAAALVTGAALTFALSSSGAEEEEESYESEVSVAPVPSGGLFATWHARF